MIILFTPPNDELILEGRKTMTARHWLKKPPRVGDIVDAQTGRKKETRFAKLKILNVVRWNGMDPPEGAASSREVWEKASEIAKKEGFEKWKHFLRCYQRLNAHDWNNSKRLHYFIEFEVKEIINGKEMG